MQVWVRGWHVREGHLMDLKQYEELFELIATAVRGREQPPDFGRQVVKAMEEAGYVILCPEEQDE